MRLKLVAGAAVLSTSATVAWGANQSTYVGALTEQPNAEIELGVRKHGGEAQIRQASVNDFSLECASGLTNTGRGFAVTARTRVGREGRFRIEGRDEGGAERWLIRGTLHRKQARGIFRFREEQRDGEPDLCRTGELRWRAAKR